MRLQINPPRPVTPDETRQFANEFVWLDEPPASEASPAGPGWWRVKLFSKTLEISLFFRPAAEAGPVAE